MESFKELYIASVDAARAKKAETPNSTDIITYEVQCHGTRSGVLIDSNKLTGLDEMILGTMTVSESVGIESCSFMVVTPNLCDCVRRGPLDNVTMTCELCCADIYDFAPETMEFLATVCNYTDI